MSADAPALLAPAAEPALSSATGGANALAAVKQLVLNAVSSPLTRVMYARALDDFFSCWAAQGRPPFTRATVQAWRAALEGKGLAPASVNLKLSAVRKLAAEVAHNGLPRSGRGRGDPGHPRRRRGVRTGNWLTKRQAEALLAAPDAATNQVENAIAPSSPYWSALGCGATRPSG